MPDEWRGPGPPWRWQGARSGHRPPWWPENEPFPPAGRGQWRWRRRFLRRIALGLGILFALTFATSALAIGLLSGAFGPRHHGGAPLVAALVWVSLLFSVFVAVGRAVRRTAQPLSDVMEAADRVASGDYRVRVQERGSGEMRRLARSFNAMAERLSANEEQRRNLLADLAHELRTPLSVIQGNLEGMLDGLYPPDQAHLEPLLEETRVMSRLLDDLQTLSTAEAGALKLFPEPVDPARLVEEAVAAFRPQTAANGVALEIRAPAGLPVLEVDPVRIGEVLANLLSNALRHTGSGDSVVVSVGPVAEGRNVEFTVEDTGSGIAPEALPHVFERFVKSADSRGAGLGLAIARSLIEAHGGEITAASEPGRGTKIRFVLPASA